LLDFCRSNFFRRSGSFWGHPEHRKEPIRIDGQQPSDSFEFVLCRLNPTFTKAIDPNRMQSDCTWIASWLPNRTSMIAFKFARMKISPLRWAKKSPDFLGAAVR
jgi:hypothetical protein